MPSLSLLRELERWGAGGSGIPHFHEDFSPCLEGAVGCSLGKKLSQAQPMPSPSLAAGTDACSVCVCVRVLCWGEGGVWRRGVKFGSGSEGWFPSSPGARPCGMNHILSFECWAHRMSRPACASEGRPPRVCQTGLGPRGGTLGHPKRYSFSWRHVYFIHPSIHLSTHHKSG